MAVRVGHDYSIKPVVVLLSDMSFTEYFQKANLLGMFYAYGERYSSDVHNEAPEPLYLGFILRNRSFADSLLDLLIGISTSPDNIGDAIGIDFIEKNNGNYVAAIYLKRDNLIRRMVPASIRDKVSPFLISNVHMQEMVISDNFLNFKKNYKEGRAIQVKYCIAHGSGTIYEGQKSFYKKEFGFYNENDSEIGVESLSFYKLMNDKENIELKEGRFPGKKRKMYNAEDYTNELIESRRESEIKNYFPILYNKLTKQNWLKDIRESLALKYTDIQVIQAICNLTLFERLALDKTVSVNLLKEGYTINIIEYLNSNYESFRSYFPEESFFSKYKIESQINKDKKELNAFLK
jgi:hypothetical protein